eukprot:GEMP01054309.1.p1 GENE.GEMP01054309.1~~GEMP01054309.1.p1  ORF type:complete len:140 (+),score=30.94 GEMP01054309.1:165-584(+)
MGSMASKCWESSSENLTARQVQDMQNGQSPQNVKFREPEPMSPAARGAAVARDKKLDYQTNFDTATTFTGRGSESDPFTMDATADNVYPDQTNEIKLTYVHNLNVAHQSSIPVLTRSMTQQEKDAQAARGAFHPSYRLG